VNAPLPWQQEHWLQLSSQILQDRLPQALLLSGPAGVGKRHFTRALAAFLLCEARSGQACGACRSCQQLAAGSHPNLFWLSRLSDDKSGKERRDIQIEQVRQLGERLALASHYDQPKLAVIEPADALNASSANALLKTVEEPPPRTHLLLVTERPQSLPATLRSRCQKLRFGVPAPEIARSWLQQAGGDPRALEEAQGAPLQALALSSGDGLQQRLDWARDWLDIARGKLNVLTFAAQVDKDQVADFIDWLIAWLGRQLQQSVLGQDGPASVHSLDLLLGQALESRAGLARNLSPALTVEGLAILWWRQTRPARGG
jgi:DNA polymerase III subunit delta'